MGSNPSPCVVCILAPDPAAASNAAESARRFHLPVHLGLTTPATAVPDTGVEAHHVSLSHGFAAARNALLEGVRASFVLWLDCDQVLLAFPCIDWSSLEGDLFAVRLQEGTCVTPRAAVRLHRRVPQVRWVGRVHEQLCSELGQAIPLLPGVALRHFGYEDAGVVAAKTERNLRLAAPGLAAQAPGYSELLCRARAQSLAGRGSIVDWLRCFSHPEVLPTALGVDRRYEPALMLCAFGYTGPAEEVLARDPLIVGLQLAVLAAGYRQSGDIDEARLAFLEECLGNGLFTLDYPFPRDLLRASRSDLEEWVRRGWPQPAAEPAAGSITSPPVAKESLYDR